MMDLRAAVHLVGETLCEVLGDSAATILGRPTPGEYIARVFEENKRRAHFIRHVIKGGEARCVSENS